MALICRRNMGFRFAQSFLGGLRSHPSNGLSGLLSPTVLSADTIRQSITHFGIERVRTLSWCRCKNCRSKLRLPDRPKAKLFHLILLFEFAVPHGPEEARKSQKSKSARMAEKPGTRPNSKNRFRMPGGCGITTGRHLRPLADTH